VFELEVAVGLKHGLHARPAALVVKKANEFECRIYLAREDERVNAKSIMGVLMLAATRGTSLTIEADGPDEKPAAEALKEILEKG